MNDFAPFSDADASGSAAGSSGSDPQSQQGAISADFAPFRDSAQHDDVEHVFRNGLITQESGGKQLRPDGTPVTSRKGAIGSAQVMPGTAPTAAALAGVPYDDLKYRTDKGYNEKLGLAYLRKQYEDFGSMPLALAAYNAGPTVLQRAMQTAAKAGNPDGWLNYLPPETRAYVPAIMARAARAAPQQQQDAQSGAGSEYIDVPMAKPRSWGDAAKDVALSAVSGVAGLVKSGGEIAGLATGDMNNVTSRVADAVQNYLQSQQSQDLQDRRAARDKAIDSDTGGVLSQAWTAFANTITDPALTADVVAGNAATMIPGAIVGRAAAAAVGGRAMVAAMEAGPVSVAARQAIAESAAKWGVGGAKVGMAIQQGADVASNAYDDAMKKTPQQLQANPEYAQRVAAGEDPAAVQRDLALKAARATFAPAAAISVGANSLPGGDAVERTLVGGAARAGGQTGSLLARTGKAALGEANTEWWEEGGGQAAANVANQQFVDPNQDLTHDVGKNAGMGAVGGFAQGAGTGPFHGSHGAAHADPAAPAAPVVPPGLEKVAATAQNGGVLSKAAMAGNTGPLADAARAAQTQQQAADQTAATTQQAAAQAETQKTDDLTQRAAQIAQSLRDKSALDALRAKDSPVKVQSVLNDLAIAQSPSARADQREQALTRLEYAMGWVGINPAAQATPAVQQIVGDATDPTAARDSNQQVAPTPDLAAARDQIDAATGLKVGPQPTAPAPQATAYDNTEAQQKRAAAAAQQDDSNAEAAGRLPPSPDVDKVIAALKVEPALRSAEQTALVKKAQSRYNADDLQLLQQSATYAAGMSATQKLRVQQLRGTMNPSLAIGRDAGKAAETGNTVEAFAKRIAGGEKLSSPSDIQFYQNNAPAIESALQEMAGKKAQPDLGPVVPNAAGAAPAGSGPAVFRKRRATLRQLIDLGMTRVEKRGSDFVLTDGKKTFKLDGAADAQLARRELQAKVEEGAAQANTEPTDGQKAAGNYKKGRVDFDGMKLGIENPIGSTRSGTAPDGKPWSVTMSAHYGDLTSTTGADGDGVDVYLAKDPRPGSPVFVFDQYNDDGSFDEHKAVLGVPTEDAAAKIYDAHFSDGSGPSRRRAVTKMSVDEFKAWANSPAAKKPAAGDKSGTARSGAAAAPAAGDGQRGADAAGGVAPAGPGRVGSEIGDGADNPAAGAARRGGETGAVDHAGERSYVTVRVRGVKKQLPVVDITKLGSSSRDGSHTRISRENAELIKSLASAFGKDVVFYENPDQDLGDGFVLPNVDSAIFLNEATSIHPLAVFGHELMHLMQRELPKVHAAIRAIVDERVKDGGAQAFRNDYEGASERHTDDRLNSDELEELTSDLGGNLMSDPAFWREVMAQVQKDHPAEARSLIAELAAKIYALIDRLVEHFNSIRQPKFRADAFVNDLKSIRGAMRQGLAKYIVETGLPKAAVQADVLRRQQGEARLSAARAENRDNVSGETRSRTGSQPAANDAQGTDAPRYGSAQAGSVSAVGVHFSPQPRDHLDASRYGTGLKGAERERLEGSENADIRPRTFFYVDKGNGVSPESGVGGHAHQVRLDNLYDVQKDPLGIVKSNSKSINDWERAVMKAGFDGYLNMDRSLPQGYAVLLGSKHNSVPVQRTRSSAASPSLEVEKKFESKPVDAHPELAKVDLEKIPGAKMKYGYLTVPLESRQQANAEMERVGSDVRFRGTPDEQAPSKTISKVDLDKAVAGVRQAIPGVKIETFEDPQDAGIKGPPGGGVGMGVTTKDGRILLFRKGIDTPIEAQRTAFHEIFHRGLAKTLSGDEYHQTMDALYESDPEVQKRAHEWGRGGEAKARQAAGMSNRMLRSLAIEEALATMAEDVGELKMQTVNAISRWLSGVAERLGLRQLADWLRSADSAQTRAFIERVLNAPDGEAKLSKARKFERVDPNEVSTRAPWGKTAAEDPISHMLVVGLDSSRASEKAFEKNVQLLHDYPNYRETKTANTTERQAERFIDHVKDNLLWLFDSVPSQIRERSHLWYDGANRISERLAKEHDLQVPQVAGVMAVLSPQKDWFMNVSLGERVIDIMRSKQDESWDQAMSNTADRIFGKEQYADDLAVIRGRKLADIEHPALKAMWLRTFDEAHNSRSYPVVSPEGESIEMARNLNGSESKVAWGDLGSISKAIAIIEDGSLRNISARLGNEHKVRNFYNNILVPGSKNGHVTIDTHAVAAALLRPLSGSSTEVLHNFGGSGAASSAIHGTSGTYGLYAEAYRRAAAERGVLPREMQSITWEAVRGLFTAGFKGQQKNTDATNAIWENFKKGRLSLENARQQILDTAGGIEEPAWFGSRPGSPAQQGAGDQAVVPGVRVSGRRAGPDAGGARGAASGTAQEAVAGLHDPRSSEAHPAAEEIKQSAARGGRDERGNLGGMPTKVAIKGLGEIEVGHWAPAEKVAREYAAAAGIAYNPPSEYVKVDVERAKRLAQAYEAMEHAPSDPAVKEAYDALVNETTAQYQAVMDSGLKVEFIDFEKHGDPYAASPRLATEDVRSNNHMWVFSTRDGFGSGDFDASSNPLLAETKFEISGKKALVNDLFRVVHDYFGHVKEGVGFRADGEENAWRAHSAMFSPLARKALTSETRGQNSFVNYGPHGAQNRKATAGETVYAPQKTGLLPDWASTEGATDARRAPARDAAVVQLRKDASVLKSLLNCLA